MRNVKVPCYGGIQYGYVYQESDDRYLKRKIAALEKLGCTHIYTDIDSQYNFDELMKRVTFRDHVLFYDHSLFKTLDQYHDLLGDKAFGKFGDYDDDIGFEMDFVNSDLLPATTVEATEWLRKLYSRHQKREKWFGWLLGHTEWV